MSKRATHGDRPPVLGLLRATCLAWGAVLAASTALTDGVRADGCFVGPDEKLDIREPEQKALIYFHDGIEDLVLSVRFEGAPEEFGWIVPLPAEPTLFAENAVIFTNLSMMTQRRQDRRSMAGNWARGTYQGTSDGVVALPPDTVGIYGTQVLQAADGAALEAWLEESGYRLPRGAEPVLSRYIRDGWVFAALKILTGAADSLSAAQLADGTIQPVRFRFTAREPVFPLEISSLGRDEEDILLYVLAPEVLVPRVLIGVTWDSYVYSTPGEQSWIYAYAHTTSGEPFLPDHRDPYYLTKHRTHLLPAQMHDVSFRPFDPAERLKYEDSAIRREAVTHLGLARPPGAEQLLVSFLKVAEQGAETYGTLWALGEVGGERAEKALLRRADDPDPDTRLEALAALGRMGSRRAVRHFVRGLAPAADTLRTDLRGINTAIRKASFEGLVRLGDAGCAPSLQSLVDTHGGVSVWLACTGSSRSANRALLKGQEPTQNPGAMALAVLATLDRGEAFQTLIDAIVLGGLGTGTDALQAAAASRRATEDFWGTFWPGEWLMCSYPGSSHWPTMRWMEELFRFEPELRDPIYRACAADPRLPPTGAVVLLGYLKAPEETDFARLREIWTEAVRPPAPAFNYTAYAVACAFSRHNRADDLEFLYRTAPANDAVLRGEIVCAMVAHRDPRFREEVLEYVHDVWNANAADEKFRTWLQAQGREEQRLAGRGAPAIALHEPPLDLTHRIEPVRNYLCSVDLDTESGIALLRDRSLNPYLRLVLLSTAGCSLNRTPSFMAMLRAEMESLLRGEGTQDRLLRQLTTGQLQVLERFAAHINSH